jgi:hypothetical protein
MWKEKVTTPGAAPTSTAINSQVTIIHSSGCPRAVHSPHVAKNEKKYKPKIHNIPTSTAHFVCGQERRNIHTNILTSTALFMCDQEARGKKHTWMPTSSALSA